MRAPTAMGQIETFAGRARIARCVAAALGLAVTPTYAADPQPMGGVAATSSSTSEEPRSQAERHFLRGLELVRRQDWNEALTEFTASRDAFPTRAATRNIAIALQNLQRYAEACDAYEALLSQFGSAMQAPELEQMRSELVSAISQTAQVVVSGGSDGIAVIIDGRERGLTPLTKPIRLDPGRHILLLTRLGFESQRVELALKARESRQVSPSLRRLAGFGVVVVREANQRQLEVVLDGARIGTTPLMTTVARGAHSLNLVGPGRLGTEPRSLVVGEEAQSIVLSADVLDADVLVSPSPHSASVFIDGVAMGPGSWSGRLRSRSHRFDVLAPGYQPFRRDIRVAPGFTRLRAVLREQRAASKKASVQLYSGISVGPLLSRSLRGGADDACGCDDRQRPFGFSAVARLGYFVLPRLGLELSAGYTRISEHMTRRMVARGEREPWLATDAQDQTRLVGPELGLGLAYQAFEQFPFTARGSAGVAFFRSESSLRGTFESTSTGDPQLIEVKELNRDVLAPFASVELRVGYRLAKRITLDVGLGLRAFFPIRVSRTDGNDLSDGGRSALLPHPWGVVNLPQESLAGNFLAATPSLGLWIRF